jgi:hypothetical protein
MDIEDVAGDSLACILLEGMEHTVREIQVAATADTFR